MMIEHAEESKSAHTALTTFTTRRTLVAALTASLALAAWPVPAADLPSPPAGLSAPAKPTAMPAFDLPTTAGTTMRSESLQGQVVIVRFWASW